MQFTDHTKISIRLKFKTMSISVVVGGQYGAEGKGLITAALVKFDQFKVLVKPGGPNSCHNYTYQGKSYRFRMLPSGCHFAVDQIVFPAGSLIYMPQLLKEAKEYRIDHSKILIDPQAGIIDDDIVLQQKKDPFYQQYGSTNTGTGYAMALRSKRRLKLAKDDEAAQPFLADTQSFLYSCVMQNTRVLVEGAQGYGLSNYHGTYPNVTSRDTTALALLSQMGLGHKTLDKVYLVIKCFPTRNKVGEGKLKGEFSESFIRRYQEQLLEFGGGSYNDGDQARRVGLFDYDLLHRACVANNPDCIVLTGLDKLEAMLNSSSRKIKQNYKSVNFFKEKVQKVARASIGITSNGSAINCVKDKRKLVSIEVGEHYSEEFLYT